MSKYRKYAELYHNELGAVVAEYNGGEATFTQHYDVDKAIQHLMFIIHRNENDYTGFWSWLKWFRGLKNVAENSN